MNNDENAYFTFKGYQLNNDSNLTSSMEDYLEMIIRLKEKQPFVRINELKTMLNQLKQLMKLKKMIKMKLFKQI